MCKTCKKVPVTVYVKGYVGLVQALRCKCGTRQKPVQEEEV